MQSWFRPLAIAVAATLPVMAQAQDRLSVYAWAEYLPDGVLQSFTKETGIKVDYATFDSNEALYAKLKLLQTSGASESYDLIFPSSYMLSKMAREGMLQPLDKSKLPNLSQLEPSLLDREFDPGNRFSVPYAFGSTAIAVNRDDLADANITAWQDLWDSQWQGQLMLTDDIRENFQMALLTLGHSANSREPEEIKAAYEKLLTLQDNVLLYNSDNPRMPYVAGEVSLGLIWSDQAYKTQQDGMNLEYVYPEEGAIFWVDSAAVPANAKSADAAHQFMDYLMRPDVAAMIIQELGIAVPNQGARALLPTDVADNPVLFPSSETVAKGHFQDDLGDEVLAVYEQYWVKLRSQ
ncbi:extracellular solute-binding protein [Zobellella taiwanensis]|jgi:spermidine/putrescine transport system substrate-binding protein|uniref:Putrescine-binding periplasmic protein n=1 Tax=Zobellella taiwanensis TaxID=347535 RepID=A0A2P7RA59_9GAMM|nr:extracellular solute-binding protein [Zobellella taiwanensis]PSJ47118.1 spermidine/putrescine ABC transporter substrate-binding protein [Zobellella taiwanensis]